jgi:hypothetical protein
MRVLVVGASGAIGTRLVPQLRLRGHRVVGSSRSPGKAGRLRGSVPSRSCWMRWAPRLSARRSPPPGPTRSSTRRPLWRMPASRNLDRSCPRGDLRRARGRNGHHGRGPLAADPPARCLWLTLTPPRGLASSRLARLVGLGTALALGAGLLASAWVDDDQTGVMGYAIFAPVAVFFLGSAIAAAVGRSLRVGVQAAVWTAVQACLLLFAVWLVEAVRWYRIDGSLLLDGDAGSIGVNLGDAVFWVMVFIPVSALPFGVFARPSAPRGGGAGGPGRSTTPVRNPTAT